MSDAMWYSRPVPETHRPYAASESRYSQWPYRQVGDSGLFLPPISLGLWYNFGDNRPFDIQQSILRHSFDVGITHFDLANNYGPPYGSAEENFGRMMRGDFKPYRDELILSTKAGWDMWPGPYGVGGSSKYLLASLDASLRRLSIDYVDIFYSHRADASTPLEETIGALDLAVRQGKARYVGISSYSASRTLRAAAIAHDLGTPLVIHQPAYSMVNRWIEDELLGVLKQTGLGSIAFTVLAQGLLSNRYLDDDVQRATARPSFDKSIVTGHRDRLRALAAIAEHRGQTLAQLALSWVLRPGGVTSALIGASSIAQVDENVEAASRTEFTEEELKQIDDLVGQGSDAAIDLWGGSATID